MESSSPFAFIVGAPRCGTTTLAGFLQQHPDVCFSAVKEPHFFTQYDLGGMADDEKNRLIDEEYLQRFFGRCSGEEKLRAEGSVTYLYAADHMPPILERWPDAKFVIALRDPLSMLPSLHARLLVTGDEAIREFPRAWAKIDERAQGRSIPRSAIDPRFLRYDEAGKLGQNVEKFIEVVGRERCHFVLFDDLSRDAEGTYRELCRFLQIEPWAQTNFSAQRGNKSIRYGWLQRFLKRPPKPMREFLAGQHYRQREKSLEGDSNEGAAIEKVFSVRKRLLRWNRTPSESRPLSIAVQQDLRNHLKSEVEKLGELIGRDLSHWLQPRDGKSKLASP